MNKKHFCDLYKIPVPVEEHFDYYIKQLSKSAEYGDIFIKLNNFKAAGETRKKSLQKFDEIADLIKNSDAYKKFNDLDVQKLDVLQKLDKRSIFEEKKKYVSFDICSANHNIIQLFANDYKPWKEFFKDDEYWLFQSKTFRQIVYGSLNCSRNVRIQAAIVSNLLSFCDLDPIFISNDEIIVEKENASILEDAILNQKENWKFSFSNKNLKFKQTTFTISKIDNKNYVKNILNNQVIDYKTLVNVPKNQFWLYYHKYILDEDSRDERNYLFINDGRLAKWLM